MSIISEAQNAAFSVLDSIMGQEVVYARSGETPLTINATHGSFLFKVDDGFGSFIHVRSSDWLLNASDLGGLGEPQRGDTITASGVVYEVSSPGTEPHFRRSNPSGSRLRVHTNEVS